MSTLARNKSAWTPDSFQVGRAGIEKQLLPKFVEKMNNVLDKQGSDLRFSVFGKRGEPDYEVRSAETVISYFEAEFPQEGRWPSGGEFRFVTIRWPERKWKRYRRGRGLYEKKPLFLISIRCDLGDAYYLDAKTWFGKAKKESFRGSVFYGVDKTDPDLGRGLETLEKYTNGRLKAVYGVEL